jgi:hypothetical protein
MKMGMAKCKSKLSHLGLLFFMLIFCSGCASSTFRCMSGVTCEYHRYTKVYVDEVSCQEELKTSMPDYISEDLQTAIKKAIVRITKTEKDPSFDIELVDQPEDNSLILRASIQSYANWGGRQFRLIGMNSEMKTSIVLSDGTTNQGLSNETFKSVFQHAGGLVGLAIDATPKNTVDMFLVNATATEIATALIKTLKKR